jgi:hypothetical protein
MRKLIFVLALLLPLSALGQTWRFAVAGDSRNCGDVVMPAIANGVKADGAALYWHLGDFRAIYVMDEDILHSPNKPANILAYFSAAWPDFIRSQIAPFAPVPVFLAIGNHDVISPKTRADYIAQFGDWLTQSPIQSRRLADDANDHMVRPYYHWIQGGIDFISMDNASSEMFDETQMRWVERILAKDATDSAVKGIVVGMHAALPHSLGCDHSMNEWAQGEYSGDRVYHDLLDFRDKTKKNVYVIASHAHFLMRDVFDSPYWRAHGGVLPGIIVGTAGAVRYRLPDTAQLLAPEKAQTDVYGYLIATVDAAGAVTFDFRRIDRASVPQDVVTRYGAELVDWCFDQNRDPNPRSSEPCSRADAPCGPAQQRPR